MKVELTNGNSAEVRDKLKGKDKFAVQDSLSFDLQEGKASQSVSGNMMTVMVNALLVKIIESWTFDGVPVPKDSANPEEILGELDIDDYNALEEFARPLIDKILQSPNRETPSA